MGLDKMLIIFKDRWFVSPPEDFTYSKGIFANKELIQISIAFKILNQRGGIGYSLLNRIESWQVTLGDKMLKLGEIIFKFKLHSMELIP